MQWLHRELTEGPAFPVPASYSLMSWELFMMLVQRVWMSHLLTEYVGNVAMQAPKVLRMPQAAAIVSPQSVGGGAPGVPPGRLQLPLQLPLQSTLQVLMLTPRGSTVQPRSQQAQQRTLPMFRALRPGEGALLQPAKQLVQQLLGQVTLAQLQMQTQLLLLLYRVMRQRQGGAPKFRTRRQSPGGAAPDLLLLSQSSSR